MQNFVRIFCALATVFLLANCTREVEKSSQIALSFTNDNSHSQKVGSQSADDPIVHLIINIRGSGISNPIKFAWDAHCNGPNCTSELLEPPPAFEFNVPAGNKRLIQVMVVTRSETDNKTSFKYGDVERDLSPGFNNINISTSALEQTSTNETKVVGRYFEAGGLTRTGRVRVEIQPPNLSRPPMHVMDEQIFGGWFKAMFLQGVTFKYFLEPYNVEIFPNASDSSSDFAASQKSLHVKLPSTFYREFDVSEFEKGSYSKVIAGFFGPGATGSLRACYDESVALDTTDIIESLYAGASTAIPLKWYGSNSAPPANTIYPENGGLSTADTLCETNNGTNYVDKLNFLPMFLTNGNDQMGGFNGPFQLIDGGGWYEDLDYSYNSATDEMTVDWTYLPGVFSGDRPITGVEIFVKSPNHIPSANAIYLAGYSEEAPCDLQLLVDGFVPVQTITGGSTSDFTLTGATDEYDTDIAVCPFRQEFGFREYFAAHARSHNTDYGGGGGGGPSGEVQFASMNAPFPPTEIASSNTMMLEIQNYSGASATLSNFTFDVPEFDFTGSTFPGTGGNCTSTLANNTTCNIEIEFSPTGEGSFFGFLDFEYDNGLGPMPSSINLYGDGYDIVDASVTFFAPHYHFGTVPIGVTTSMLITVTNWGDSDATDAIISGLSSSFDYVGGAYPGDNGNCPPEPFTLPATSSCNVEIEFAPTSAIGNTAIALTLDYEDSSTLNPEFITTTIEAEAVEIGFSPSYLSFQNVAPSSNTTQTLTLVNESADTITNLQISPALTSPFSITGGTCTMGGSLASGSNCTIIVQYAAPSSGNHSAPINLNYNITPDTFIITSMINANVATDTTPPAVPTAISLNSPSTSPGNDNTPTFQVDGLTSGDFVDLYADPTCSVLKATVTAAGASALVTSSSLTDNNYTFKVRARDAAGNASLCSSSPTVTYVLDTIAPDAPVWLLPKYYSNSTIYSPFYVWGNGYDYQSGFSHFQISLGSSSGATNIVSWTNIYSNAGSFDGLSLTEGNTYHFNIRTVDLAGNYSTVASDSFVVDLNRYYIQEAYAKVSNRLANHTLGERAVSVSGHFIAAGLPHDSSNATGVTIGSSASANTSLTDAGAVFLFKQGQFGWDQAYYIKPDYPVADDLFGFSVALSGDTLVVGAPQDSSNYQGIYSSQQSPNSSAAYSGAVYVYKYFSGTWILEAYIKSSNSEANDGFGTSVDIHGDTIVVGAPDEDSYQATITNGTSASSDNSYSASGAVYVYKRTSSTWAQEAYIKAANVSTGDNFGNKVAIHNNTIAVGVYLEDSNQNYITNGTGATANNSYADSGAAYVYFRTGSSWAQQAYLKASNSAANLNFGDAIDIHGDRIVVGAWSDNSDDNTVDNNDGSASANASATDAGAAYVFKRASGSWTQTAYLKAPNSDGNDGFGGSVAIHDRTIVVGSPLEDANDTSPTQPFGGASSNNSAADAGAVYVFNDDGTDFWSQTHYLKAGNSEAGDMFGSAVCIDRTTIVIGAPFEDSNTNTMTNGPSTSSDNSVADSGALYFLDLQ